MAPGKFEWGGENFSHSAENVSFSIEGGASVPVLRADLRTVDGQLVHGDINLAERIENQNGVFVFGKLNNAAFPVHSPLR